MRLLSVSDVSSKQNGAPDPVGCNTVALGVIRGIYNVGNREPLLLLNNSTKTEPVLGHGRWGRKERKIERALFWELSSYYPRSTGCCTTPQLLSRCKHERFQCVGDISLTHSFYQWCAIWRASRKPRTCQRRERGQKRRRVGSSIDTLFYHWDWPRIPFSPLRFFGPWLPV